MLFKLHHNNLEVNVALSEVEFDLNSDIMELSDPSSILQILSRFLEAVGKYDVFSAENTWIMRQASFDLDSSMGDNH